MFYQVNIRTKTGSAHDIRRFDLLRDQLEHQVLRPYRQGNPITLGGKTIQPHDIEQITIFITEEKCEKRDEMARLQLQIQGFKYSRTEQDITDDLITGPPGCELHKIEKAITSMKIFISHSSDDVEVAILLIDLLQRSLNLRSPDIRCSSVDGFRLPGGVSTDQSLRDEVHEAEMVIGLITPNSLKSAYVSFELGARWGADKPMIPLLASGATPEHLGGPLAGINALDCGNESQVHQLVEDAARHLNVERDQTSSYVAAVRSLIHISSESAVAVEQQSTIAETPLLSEEAKRLLIEAVKDKSGLIHKIKLNNGLLIRVNGIALNEVGNRRSEAMWEGAINDLIERGIVKDYNGKGTSFSLTDKGYTVADSLEGTQQSNHEIR